MTRKYRSTAEMVSADAEEEKALASIRPFEVWSDVNMALHKQYQHQQQSDINYLRTVNNRQVSKLGEMNRYAKMAMPFVNKPLGEKVVADNRLISMQHGHVSRLQRLDDLKDKLAGSKLNLTKPHI
jgi:hypothetical protein